MTHTEVHRRHFMSMLQHSLMSPHFCSLQLLSCELPFLKARNPDCSLYAWPPADLNNVVGTAAFTQYMLRP